MIKISKTISVVGFAQYDAFKKLIFFAVFILFGFSAIAQTTTTFPSPSSCNSKDLELVSATLTGGDLCNSCTPGSTLTRTLVLGINNKTGSTRTAFAFWGTLVITHSDGTTQSTLINRCSGPIPPTGPLPAAYTGGSFGTVTYQCGDALRLTNLFLAWTDASPNSTCASLNSATISPKCGTLPSILINAGVNGSFNITDAGCTTTGSMAVSPFGGKAPYSVVMGVVIHSGIAAGAITTFSGLPAGSYSGTITDSNSCSFNFNRTIGAPSQPNAPAATVMQPTCAVGTGTCNVTSPVSGTTYTLRQNGNIMHTAVNGVFSSVPSGTYALVAALGVCTVNGSNVIVNAQPQTPAIPAAAVSQPTCSLGTATCTIVSPVSGVTYTLSQNGNVMHTAVNGIFSGVSPGTYGLNAANSTCNSNGNNVVVNTQPQTPSVPTVCVVQPSLCGPVTGSVTILSPIGQGIEYSIDNGSTWQSSPTFDNLAAGSVTGIKAKKDGCVSGAAMCTDSNCSQTIARVVEAVPIEIAANNEVAGFDAFPVPFKDMITLKYKFNYTSPVKIEVFNSQGMSVFKEDDPNGYVNKEFAVNLNFNIKKEQMYIIKLTTNLGSTVKKVISSK